MIPFYAVIPARYASTRLPHKALLPIGGKPMVVRVAERVARSGAQQIWIATDHPSILAAAQEHGFMACLTREDHASGTDRIAEVAVQQNWDDETIVVNVQGDEPLIPPALIRMVAFHLHDHPHCDIATACHPIHDQASLRNPNVVKVVLDKSGDALYFSRAPIPWPRDAFRVSPSSEGRDDCSSSLRGEVGRGERGLPTTEVRGDQTSLSGGESGRSELPAGVPALRHIGLYAYRVRFLRAFGGLDPAPLERVEMLEQLRALWHGYRIGVAVVQEAPPHGVDTEQDLQAVRSMFEASV